MTCLFRERWRTSPSLPGHEVSSLGRIRKKVHSVPMPRGGFRKYGGKPRFGAWLTKEKRFIITYKRKTYKMSRLICEAFHGPAPFQGAVAMHKDEDSSNNLPSNLKWGTQKQNLNAPGFLAYCRSRTGDANPFNKGMAKKGDR